MTRKRSDSKGLRGLGHLTTSGLRIQSLSGMGCRVPGAETDCSRSRAVHGLNACSRTRPRVSTP
jgi:hypothetical protein